MPRKLHRDPAASLQKERGELCGLLQTAFELEWATIPPYMMALMSIQRPHNRVAARLIRSVMVEEMLHMTLVANLVSSLGTTVSIGKTNVPSYPLSMKFEGRQFKDRLFDIDLAPFSEDAIQTFLNIELPGDWPQVQVFYAVAIPGYTVGEFYGLIIESLERLCTAHGEASIFTGNPERQIGPEYYWSAGGAPIVIKDLSTARQALKAIIDQGEGTDLARYATQHQAFNTEELAHFFRFQEIWYGRHYKPGDDPLREPTGDAFEVNYSAAYPIKKNPRSSDYVAGSRLAELNDQFNRAYTVMLVQLGRAFDGSPQAMYTAIMNGMHEMTSIAEEMVAAPIQGDPQGLHGTPSFEWLEPIVVV